jgi:hypothetical protein
MRPHRHRERRELAARSVMLAVRLLSLRGAQGLRADQESGRRHGADFGRGSADRHGRRRLILATIERLSTRPSRHVPQRRRRLSVE